MSRGLTREEILRLRREHVLPSLFTYYAEPLQLVRGAMQHVWDDSGRRYLDFFGGIVSISVGHCHPEIVEEVTRQLAALQHTTCIYLTEPLVLLAAKLAALAPGKLNKCYFPNSGSEANEMALLLARNHRRHAEVLCLRHAYHGGTAGTLALVGQSTWRFPIAYPQGVVHLPQPNCYRCTSGGTFPGCGLRCAEEIEEVIRTSTSGEIAALIVEPIQGFGGFVEPPPGYLPRAAEIVRAHGGLFIADEVQTGVGLTGGHWWGISHSGVEPDIMTMAKGFGNGATIGGVVATDEVANALQGKLHFNTFGGNAPYTLQALLTLELIEREGYVQRNVQRGAELRAGLQELQTRHRLIGDIRGRGLLVGVELVSDRQTKQPATRETLRVLEETRERGLLIGKGGMPGNVLRLTPPFCITAEDVATALTILDEALTATEQD